MATRTLKETRLSRDSWLQHALEILKTEGIQGVRVERLARDLGVTKGSFYWHFKDRGDLQLSMLDYWGKRFTDVVVENRELIDDEPSEGLLAAMVMVRKDGLDEYELAIRAWADHDAQARAALQAVYEKRKKFIRRFFTRLGFRGLQAEVRTTMALCYLSWEPNMYPDESKPQRLKLVKLQHEILTRS